MTGPRTVARSGDGPAVGSAGEPEVDEPVEADGGDAVLSRVGHHLAQNEQRATRPLAMPVLAIGGAESWGEAIGNLATDDVQIVVIPGVGHWVAEQDPDEMLAALTGFLAPYRDGEGAAHVA